VTAETIGEGLAFFCWCRLQWPQYTNDPGPLVRKYLVEAWRSPYK
jgi:hypothetical protein